MDASVYTREEGLTEIEAERAWNGHVKEGLAGVVLRCVLKSKRDDAVESLINASSYEEFRERQGLVKGIDRVIAITQSTQKITSCQH